MFGCYFFLWESWLTFHRAFLHLIYSLNHLTDKQVIVTASALWAMLQQTFDCKYPLVILTSINFRSVDEVLLNCRVAIFLTFWESLVSKRMHHLTLLPMIVHVFQFIILCYLKKINVRRDLIVGLILTFLWYF